MSSLQLLKSELGLEFSVKSVVNNVDELVLEASSSHELIVTNYSGTPLYRHH